MSTSTFYNVFLLMTFCNSKAYGSLHTIATLAERFSRASSNGESIHWRVVDDYDKYSRGSSLWFFSSDANIYLESSKWNAVSGSKFSNNDGTWGLGNGRIDGSSRCGIKVKYSGVMRTVGV